MMNKAYQYNMEEFTFYDNKGMAASAPPTRPETQTSSPFHDTTDSSSKRTNKCLSRFRALLRLPYFINLVISVIVLTLLGVLEFGILPGNKTGFFCKDPNLSQKYSGDTITATVLLVGSAILPFLVIIFVESLHNDGLSQIVPKWVWYYYKECLIGGIFVLLITEIFKILVGEHRPHFFDVCQPDSNSNCLNGTYVYKYTCMNKKYSNYFLTDTSRSFPSGHASLSVFVALYCAYVVQTRMPTRRTGRLFKPFFICACLTWGIFCSISRIIDKRHHWWDVLAGSTIGICSALYFLKVVHQEVQRSSQDNKTKDSANV